MSIPYLLVYLLKIMLTYQHMENSQRSKPDEIAELFCGYCEKHLDDEYLFKTILSEDEKIDKIDVPLPKQVHLYFYGRLFKVLSFEKKLRQSGRFSVSDILNNFK